MSPRGKVIVSGIAFWYPLAGVTYQFLHYLIGLRQLGYDAYYVEDSARWVYDPLARTTSADASPNVRRVSSALEAHGFAGKWAFRGAYPGGARYGLGDRELLELYREADVLLNVTGAQELRQEHLAIRRRVYVETDPFGAQVKLSQADAHWCALIDGHHDRFTFGENVGQPDCGIPLDRAWLPTRQPIALELWAGTSEPRDPPRGAAYNTITTWHNDGKSVEHRGELYHWTKDREFERYLALPSHRPGCRFELATDASTQERARIAQRGFALADGVAISSGVASYRAYIAGARAEFTVARDQYVRPRTGWFSDRSACYLAAGKPVITQETGFSKFLPSGRGLFAFESLDDALAAVDAIESDPLGHARAARELAREYFAADKVVGALMERIGT